VDLTSEACPNILDTSYILQSYCAAQTAITFPYILLNTSIMLWRMFSIVHSIIKMVWLNITIVSLHLYVLDTVSYENQNSPQKLGKIEDVQKTPLGIKTHNIKKQEMHKFITAES
jgi:hypothetical protein